VLGQECGGPRRKAPGSVTTQHLFRYGPAVRASAEVQSRKGCLLTLLFLPGEL
jgi:hypothetical protein